MASEGDREPRQTVGSVTRAVALLDALAGSDAGLGVNELARRIGVNASTASRLLATLERERIVERSPGGPYRLGLKLVELADRVLAGLGVRGRAGLPGVPTHAERVNTNARTPVRERNERRVRGSRLRSNAPTVVTHVLP